MSDTVWIVQQLDESSEVSIAVIAHTLKGAKAATARYVGSDLNWLHRNSMFDSQDYLVATHDGDEYHLQEMDVES